MSDLADKLRELLATGKDVAQGASNAVAGNVSWPVDLISAGLRKVGLGDVIGSAPVGGSEWMAQKGLTRQPTNALAGMAGETLGMAGPMVAAAKAPQIANGLVKMGENALAPATMNPQRGAIVYHGSPHSFDAFDMSKIGTGEGAQAYGHGLYFAESPGVAKEYQSRLANLATSRDAVGDDVKSAMTMLRAWKDPVKAKEVLTRPGGLYKMTSEQADAAIAKASDQGSFYKVDLPDS